MIVDMSIDAMIKLEFISLRKKHAKRFGGSKLISIFVCK